jgi:pimeloyl-ACP methyl ester carboxylesterase
VIDTTLPRPDGRTVGYTDTGNAAEIAVLWCHGGPGSRFEGGAMAPEATAAGLRVVGIDRPGYGVSTPQPERTIAAWVPDALAVLDALDIAEVIAVGVSTGGAYALACAADATARVRAVVACCALTDMQWPEGRAMMSAGETHEIWDAPTRADALRIAEDALGADGSKLMTRGEEEGITLPPADLAVLMDVDFLTRMAPSMAAMFAFGVQGYTDDRRADGPGWRTFDVTRIGCPVAVIHGGSDPVVPVAHAEHTAAIVPGATLRVFDELGHFSIMREIVPAIARLV